MLHDGCRHPLANAVPEYPLLACPSILTRSFARIASTLSLGAVMDVVSSSLGLEQYEAAFRENEINEPVLRNRNRRT
jgi:hypothetical protein